MPHAQTILAGAVCALAGCVFPAYLFELALKGSTKVDVASGLAGILVSFVLLTLAEFAVYLVAAEEVLVFGCAMVATFLIFWSVEALRAWRAANGGPSRPRS